MPARLLATTALLLVVSSGAYAQTPSGMMSKGYNMQKTDALASKVIGSPVYSTIVTNNGTPTTPANGAAGNNTTTNNNAMSSATNTAQPGSAAPASGMTATNPNGVPANNATDTSAQQIGSVRDLVLGADGTVKAAVIGIGGFMGMGEKNVAVDYTQLHWAVAQDGTVRATLDTTVDALKAAPGFNYPASGEATTSSAPPVNGSNTPMANTGTPSPATMPAAQSPAMANDNGTPMGTTAPAPANNQANAPEVNPSSLKPINPTTISADDLRGIDVLDPAGHKIASTSSFVLTQDGKIDAVVVDFGGFLGIGSKQIALAFQGLKFMQDNANKRYLVVNLTRDQLNAQRPYNKDDYAANRNAERLAVSP